MHESLSLLRIGWESRNHERQPGLCHYRTCGNAWKLHTEFVTINSARGRGVGLVGSSAWVRGARSPKARVCEAALFADAPFFTGSR